MSLDRIEIIEIDSLVLRVPGITPGDARELAAQVAAAIQRRLHRVDHIDHVDRVELGALQVRIPDAPRERWPELIAERLIESLVEGRHG